MYQFRSMLSNQIMTIHANLGEYLQKDNWIHAGIPSPNPTLKIRILTPNKNADIYIIPEEVSLVLKHIIG